MLWRILSVGLLSVLPLIGHTKPVIILSSFSAQLSSAFAASIASLDPDIELQFINKKTSAALTHLENRLYPRPDLVIVSATDAFDWLSQHRHLERYRKSDRLAYTPFAMSGYGFMLNKQYLSKAKLPSPVSWQDLLDPIYQRHIVMTSPSRSGTTHIIVETVLQERGWQEGWAYLMELSGNLATITARSFGVRQGLMKQRFAIGLSIDFFAITAAHNNPNIDFVYPLPTSYLPVSAGLIRGGDNLSSARHLIELLLSKEGQRVLMSSKLSRFPVDEKVLLAAPENHPLRYYRKNITHTLNYDARQSVGRYQLVNALFDQMITLRLEFLQQAWADVNEIKNQLNTPSLQAYQVKLDQVVAQLREVPFKEPRLSDRLLLSSFSQQLPGTTLSARQQQEQKRWQDWSHLQQDQVSKALSQIKVLLKRETMYGLD